MMRDASAALIQHFNPACRIARAYPAYPLSRILFSLNDFDVCIDDRPWPWPWPGLGLLWHIAHLPQVCQVVLAQCAAVCVLNLVAVALYELAAVSHSAGPPLALVLGFCVAVVVREVAAYRRHRRAVLAAEERKSEQLFRMQDRPQAEGGSSTYYDDLNSQREEEEGEEGKGEGEEEDRRHRGHEEKSAVHSSERDDDLGRRTTATATATATGQRGLLVFSSGWEDSAAEGRRSGSAADEDPFRTARGWRTVSGPPLASSRRRVVVPSALSPQVREQDILAKIVVKQAHSGGEVAGAPSIATAEPAEAEEEADLSVDNRTEEYNQVPMARGRPLQEEEEEEEEEAEREAEAEAEGGGDDDGDGVHEQEAEGADDQSHREMLVPFDCSILVDEFQLDARRFALRDPDRDSNRCEDEDDDDDDDDASLYSQYGVRGPDRAAAQGASTLKRPNRSRRAVTAKMSPNRSIRHPRIFGSIGKPNPRKMLETRRRLKRRIFDANISSQPVAVPPARTEGPGSTAIALMDRPEMLDVRSGYPVTMNPSNNIEYNERSSKFKYIPAEKTGYDLPGVSTYQRFEIPRDRGHRSRRPAGPGGVIAVDSKEENNRQSGFPMFQF